MKRALLVLLLLGACAVASEPAIVLGPVYRGVTDCRGGVPVSVVRGGLSVEDSAEVDAHEAVHRRQMRGNCVGVMARYRNDRAFRVQMETEAYCAGIRVHPDTVYAARREETLAFVLRMFPDIPGGDVKRLFARHCP
jgi:hypothetical protein